MNPTTRPVIPPAPASAPPATLDKARLRRAEEASDRQWRALSYFAIAAFAVVVWIVLPVSIGILLGTCTAFTLETMYEELVRRTHRPRLAAISCVLLAGGAIAGVGAAVTYLLIARGATIAEALLASLSPGGPARAVVEQLDQRLPAQLRIAELTTKLRDAAAELVSRAASLAAVLAQTAFGGLLIALFAVLTAYFVLCNWSSIIRRAEDMLPLDRRHTHTLFEELRKVGRTTLLGTVGTGVAQGLLATLGYWIFGLPEAAFFGTATAVASLIPAVGTMLVWVPAGIYLLLTGHPGSGVGLLVYGTVVVVGVSDYVLRPRLVGGHDEMPALLVFASLFGGVEVFGLVGLILGPLTMSIAVALLRIYAVESAVRKSQLAASGDPV